MSNGTITVDNKTYKLADLPEEVARLAANVAYCDEQLGRLKNEAAVLQTARSAYVQALVNQLSTQKAADQPAAG